jgi:HlyD family secretion protein
MRPLSFLLTSAALITALGCNGEVEPDAYGNFEGEEVVVSAQVGGPLLTFDAVEGQQLTAGALAAVVDTTPLVLERQQLSAQRSVIVSRRNELSAQRASVESQLEIAQRGLARTTRLKDGDAATAQQLDGAERDVRVLSAQRDALAASSISLGAELAATDARLASLSDRLSRASVRAPIAGTVLTTYARVGESVQPGQALFAMADLNSLTLRAYVSGDQLGTFKLGQKVTVRVSIDGSLMPFPGEIAWVSARAEFTPTPVQTRDERAELVYAVKVRVRDAEGRLKIGMPGDVTLEATP